MAYALGDDRAKEYLTADRRRFPTLDRQLGVARGIVQAPLPEGDLYSAWFGAVRALASEPAVPTGATAPSFMTTPAFADARLGSVIAAFGQVRHNYVLLSGQGYDAYGCEIPDGWVEPAPDAYDALARYADRGAATFRAFDPSDRSHAAAYFARLGRLMRVFRAIAASELAGRPLSTDERRFLAMVVEHVPLQANCDSCPPPTYTGWWFDLFLARVKDGLSPGAFMADFYTSTNEQRIAYVGATAARLGVFVVDTGGPPRAFVGPVSHAFEYTGPTDRRLTDADAERASRDGRAPWAASYTAAAPAEPPLQLIVCSEGVGSPWCLEQLPAAAKRHVKTGDKTPAIVAVSTRALGNVTVELLDHHRVPVARDTRAVDANGAAFHFPGALGVHAAPSPGGHSEAGAAEVGGRRRPRRRLPVRVGQPAIRLGRVLHARRDAPTRPSAPGRRRPSVRVTRHPRAAISLSSSATASYSASGITSPTCSSASVRASGTFCTTGTPCCSAAATMPRATSPCPAAMTTGASSPAASS